MHGLSGQRRIMLSVSGPVMPTVKGRPGLTGISAAAPILFDLAGIMEPVPWFSAPFEEMTTIRVCSKSGYRAGPDCPETEEISACVNGLRSEACPYHRIVHLNKSGTLQVTSDCTPPIRYNQ